MPSGECFPRGQIVTDPFDVVSLTRTERPWEIKLRSGVIVQPNMVPEISRVGKLLATTMAGH